MGNYSNLINLINTAEKSNLGYDQGQRWSFLDRKNKRIIPGAECDCSALSMGLAYLAGYPVNIDAQPCFTGTAADIMRAAGWKVSDVSRWSLAQINDASVAGCHLVGVGHMLIKTVHGNLWLSANIDENGNIVGGRPGNQTGSEVSVRELWNRHDGWQTLITPPDVVTVSVPSTSVVMMRGSRGPRVAALQRGLLAVFPSYAAPIKSSGGADGIFGDATDAVVREFQRRSGLSVDGIVGPQTLAKLVACGIRI